MLKISVGDADHRRDRVSIRFPSDVGDAVFRDDHVAERAWERRIRIGPDYVGLESVSQMAPTAHGDDRPSVLELMRHGNEIVLASDAAHDAPVFQSVRRDGAQERRRHRCIDKSRMPTVGALMR